MRQKLETTEVLSRGSLMDLIFPQYWEFMYETRSFKISPTVALEDYKNDFQYFALMNGTQALASLKISNVVLEQIFLEIPTYMKSHELSHKFGQILISLIVDPILQTIETKLDITVEVVKGSYFEDQDNVHSSKTFDISEANTKFGQFTLTAPTSSPLHTHDQTLFTSNNLKLISNNNIGMSFILGAIEVDAFAANPDNSFSIGKKDEQLPGLLQISENQFIPARISSNGTLALEKAGSDILGKNFLLHSQIQLKEHVLVKKRQETFQHDREFISDILRLGKIEDIFSLAGEAYIEMPDNTQIIGQIISENGMINFKKTETLS